MKSRPLAVALLLALAPATLPMPVWAQAPAEDATTSMARARFKEGVEFYDKGEYEQARASFLQAYALKKHPAVLLNLAWSCLKSGHAMEAEKYFRQFLAEGKDITDKQRADANDGLKQARSKLGSIEVSAVPGTEVTVDGEKVGTTPLTDPVSVEAGAHTVKFKSADGSTDTQSVTVLGGEKAVARFKAAGGAGGGTAPATTPETKTTTPETETKTASNATPPGGETKPAEDTSHKEAPIGGGGGGGPLAPPKNLVPAIILFGASVAAFGAAGLMLVYKNQAQNNATTVANEIIKNVPAGRTASGICASNTPANFVQACNDYATDTNQVNQDATAGNILAGVGVAALVGAGIYWVVADKGTGAPDRGAVTKPVVVPIVGRTQSGVSLSFDF
jgi:hypothetical protein